VILPAHLHVSRESQAKLALYVETLEKWQKQINLIAPSTVGSAWSRHVADSLQLLPHIPNHVTTIADLGTGAGFPGLALALVRPLHAHLYESNGKKVAFLREVIRRTGAAATVHQMRIEDLARDPNLPVIQLVLSRAFAPLDQLLGYAEPLFQRGARALFHKGQDVDAELTEAAKYWKLQFKKHPSSTDSKACLLEVEEAYRVARAD
jgi:16S rRNA (guanine527-N7)-methyltransferase